MWPTVTDRKRTLIRRTTQAFGAHGAGEDGHPGHESAYRRRHYAEASAGTAPHAEANQLGTPPGRAAGAEQAATTVVRIAGVRLRVSSVCGAVCGFPVVRTVLGGLETV